MNSNLTFARVTRSGHTVQLSHPNQERQSLECVLYSALATKYTHQIGHVKVSRLEKSSRRYLSNAHVWLWSVQVPRRQRNRILNAMLYPSFFGLVLSVKNIVSVLNIFIAAQHWPVLQCHPTNTLDVSPSFFFLNKKNKTGLNHRVKVLVS